MNKSERTTYLMSGIMSLFLLVFLGCGDGGDGDDVSGTGIGAGESNSLVGTWIMDKRIDFVGDRTNPDFTVTYEPPDAQLTLTFNADNTWKSTDIGGGLTLMHDGTWSTSGNKLTISGNILLIIGQIETNEIWEFSISGSKLTMEMEVTTFFETKWITMTLTKQ